MSSNETLNDNTNQFTLVERIIVAVIFACFCISGIIGIGFILYYKIRFLFFLFFKGNLIVLIVAIRKQNYKFVTNCYIINLAITDLLFLLISVPLTAHLGLTNTWILAGFVSCHIQVYIAHVRHILFYHQYHREIFHFLIKILIISSKKWQYCI
jgi:hypothetical protein